MTPWNVLGIFSFLIARFPLGRQQDYGRSGIWDHACNGYGLA